MTWNLQRKNYDVINVTASRTEWLLLFSAYGDAPQSQFDERQAAALAQMKPATANRPPSDVHCGLCRTPAFRLGATLRRSLPRCAPRRRFKT